MATLRTKPLKIKTGKFPISFIERYIDAKKA